jgi:hypothetical protein
VSEGCRKSVAARRQRPRSRFGLVCGTTQAAELDQRKPDFLVMFSEKCRFYSAFRIPHSEAFRIVVDRF